MMTRMITALFLLFALGAAVPACLAESDSAPPSDGSVTNDTYAGDQQTPDPVPDSSSAGESVSSLPPTGPTRSFLNSGIHISQGISTNEGALFGNSSGVAPVTELYGNANLLWVNRRSQTALDYLAGTTFYEGSRRPGSYENQKTQSVDLQQRYTWRTTQLTVRDSLQNLRENGLASTTLTTTGAYIQRFAQAAATEPVDSATSDFLGTRQLSQPDQRSSLSNMFSVDVTRFLSRRSSVFVTGGYSFVDYLGESQGLVNVHQFSLRAGYNHQLNRKENVGFVYGFRSIRFPQAGAGTIATNSLQLVYSRKLSERMTISGGGGPEFAVIHRDSGDRQQRVNSTLQAALSYDLRRTNLALSYGRLVTAGNGIFAGANSNAIRFSADRRLFRSYQLGLNGGYSNVSRLTKSTALNLRNNSYRYLFFGAALQRPLGRSLTGFVTYQFENQNINSLLCGSSAGCASGLNQRHVAAIGIDWNLRPMRLQ